MASWEDLLTAAKAAYTIAFHSTEQLEPIAPLGPLFYDRSSYLIVSEEVQAYWETEAMKPIYLDRGLTIAEEKAYYMRFLMNTDQVAIRLLHAYYKACGIEDKAARLARLQQLSKLRI